MTSAAHNDVPTRRARRQDSRPPRIDERQVYTVDETCAALAISKSQFYVLRARGVISTHPQLRGRVTGAEIIRFVAAAA